MIGFTMQLCEFFRECIDGEHCPYIDQCKILPKIPSNERKEIMTGTSKEEKIEAAKEKYMDILDKESDKFDHTLSKDGPSLNEDMWLPPAVEFDPCIPQIFTRLHRIGNTTFVMQRLNTEKEWTPTFSIIGDFDIEVKGDI